MSQENRCDHESDGKHAMSCKRRKHLVLGAAVALIGLLSLLVVLWQLDSDLDAELRTSATLE